MAQQASGGRAPGWLSTHPDPGDRYRSLLATIRQDGTTGGLVQREGYLKRLDGLVFGDDPREGFFRDRTFYHPQMAFRFALPPGFEGRNTKQAVTATSSGGDAAVELTLAKESSVDAAARAFFTEVRGESRRRQVNGLGAVVGDFDATSGSTAVRGVATFVGYQGKVFRLVGYARASSFSRYRDALEDCVTSFAPLRESWALQVQPARVDLVVPDRDMTLDEFLKKYPSTAKPETIALVNQLGAGDVLKAGRQAKRIVGGTDR